MSGLGCWVALGAAAYERRRAGVLRRAGHGGGEVAAAELVGVAWQGMEGSSARGSGSRGSRRCHVRRWGKQEEACGLPRRRRRHSALAAVKQRGREVEDEVWTDSQNLKSSRVPL